MNHNSNTKMFFYTFIYQEIFMPMEYYQKIARNMRKKTKS